MADIEFEFDPITVNAGVTIAGLDNVKVDSKLAVTQPIETKSTLSIPDTVKTDSKITLAPIKTDSSIDTTSKVDTTSAIDLQPVVVDQCLKLTLGQLPPTLICLPNRQRIGLTLFGVEVLGLTLDGEAKVIVSDLPKPPHVIHLPAPHDPGHHAAGPHAHPGAHEHHQAPHDHASHGANAAQKAPAPGKAPFVIRLGG